MEMLMSTCIDFQIKEIEIFFHNFEDITSGNSHCILISLFLFVEKAADSPYSVHDRMVHVSVYKNTAMVNCSTSLGYVFLWR